MPNNAIANCSSESIKNALKIINKQQFPKQRLIGPKNYFLHDTISKTDGLLDGSIDEKAIAHYIAASIIPHCFDGWNYLSRAIESYLNGDISSTIHFAYYSELRAVMSIMACNGIGIFNKKHIYFNSSLNAVIIPSSTHVIAKQLIKAWGDTNSHRDNILRMIVVNNRNLYDWISAISGYSGHGFLSTVLNDWLSTWSIDLQLGEDQIIRNETSYRPHFDVNKLNIKDDLKSVSSMWSGLEPIRSNSFNAIDMYLVRNALEEIYRYMNGVKKINKEKYSKYLENIFSNLGESKDQYLFDFLLRNINSEDHILLIEAKKDIDDRNVNYKNPLPIVCRGLLLLRLATGSVLNILNECNIKKDSLSFWWHEKAEAIGIVKNIPPGFDACDLYSDISFVLNEIQSQISLITTRRDAITLLGNEINDIKQFQRVCFWGLGL